MDGSNKGHRARSGGETGRSFEAQPKASREPSRGIGNGKGSGEPLERLPRAELTVDRTSAFESALKLIPGKSALLVVDMQRAFLDPGEAMEVPAARDIVP